MRTSLLVLAACAFALSGCAVRVAGFVTDSVTGNPVSTASVTIGDRSTQADAAGHYSLKARLNTKEKVVFSAPGYAPQEFRLKKRDERFPVLDVKLAPAAPAAR